jgi:6-phosphogluconolactonase (cycloisomerase 2 family)
MPLRLPRAALAAVALTALIPAAAHAAPRSLYAISTNVTPPVERAVTAYLIGDDGALTDYADFDSGADDPTDVAVSPDGRFVYAAFDSASGGGVYVVAVQPDGSFGTWTRVPAGSSATAVAVSPDGRFLYLGDYGGAVRTFAIGSDGMLTPVGAPAPGPADIGDIAVSPDGTHVYVSYVSDWTVGTLAVGADGVPSLLATVPVNGGLGTPIGLTITAPPLRLIVQDTSWNADAVFPIAADGSLGTVGALALGGFAGGPVAASPTGPFSFAVRDNGTSSTIKTFANGATMTETASFPVGASIAYGGVAVSPDGRAVYARDRTANTIRRFSVDGVGALTEAGAGVPVYPTTYLAGHLVASPDQPPVAGFTTELFGLTVVVDALDDTTDPDGETARYDWDFGDGTTLEDGGPITAHDYAQYGTYTVTLTATDDQGCSTQRTYTGSTVGCNGGPGARTTRTITIAPPVVVLPPRPTTADTPQVGANAEPSPPAAHRVLPAIDGRGAGPARATRRGRVTLPELTAVCTAGAGPCDDNAVAVNATVRGQRVTLGTAAFGLADGASTRISLRLSQPGRRLLARARSLDVQALVRVRNAATAAQATRAVDLTLLAPRHRRSS